MFAFKFEVCTKKSQLFKVLSTGTNTYPQPCPPLINCLVDDALLQLSSAFKFLQGSVATLFRWRWKILPYFVANLSTTLRINFCQNRSRVVEVMTKMLVCFYASYYCMLLKYRPMMWTCFDDVSSWCRYRVIAGRLLRRKFYWPETIINVFLVVAAINCRHLELWRHCVTWHRRLDDQNAFARHVWRHLLADDVTRNVDLFTELPWRRVVGVFDVRATGTDSQLALVDLDAQLWRLVPGHVELPATQQAMGRPLGVRICWDVLRLDRLQVRRGFVVVIRRRRLRLRQLHLHRHKIIWVRLVSNRLLKNIGTGLIYSVYRPTVQMTASNAIRSFLLRQF